MKDLHLIMEELIKVVYDIDTFEYVLNSLELAYEASIEKEGNYIINSAKIYLKDIKGRINIIANELDKNM